MNSIIKLSLLSILIIIFINEAFGQFNVNEYNDMMWLDDNPATYVNEVPEKWKEESTVILYEKQTFSYTKKGLQAVRTDYSSRVRIKLLDETSVKENSEWFLSQLTQNANNRDEEYFGMKIVKPDGSEILITIDNLVKVENAVSDAYGDDSYYKLALPGLEVGDIIDYYYVSSLTFHKEIGNDVFFEFFPEIIILSKEFPILNGSLEITPERHAHLNVKYLNGVEPPLILNREDAKTYVFNYNNMEKHTPEQMIFPLREYPAIVFQIIIASKKDVKKTLHFLGGKDKAKTSVTEGDLLEMLKRLDKKKNNSIYSISLVKNMLKEDNSSFGPNPSDSLIIARAYYNIRFALYFKEAFYFGNKYFLHNLVDEFEFILAYASLIEHYEIGYDLGLCIPQVYGNLDQIILKDQVLPVLRTRTDPPVFIVYPEINSICGQTPLAIENSTFYFIDPNDKSRSKLITDQIPVSKPTDNMEIDTILASFNGDEESYININNTLYSYGGSKDLFQEYFLTAYNYYLDDLEAIAINGSLTPVELSDYIKILTDLASSKNTYIKSMQDRFHDFLMVKYNDENQIFDSVKLISTGRFSNIKPLKYQYSTQLSNYIQRAGKYTVIDIGRLIGKNKEFTKEELTRKSDIYLDSPMQVNWVILFDFPADYIVKDYNNLNYNISNETGYFKSEAKVLDQRLIVNITKTYNKKFYPAESWDKVLEFLNAAIDFTQQQILLEKVE